MATRFVTTHASNNAAINDLADRFNKTVGAVTDNDVDTSVEMTAAEFMSGLYINSADGALEFIVPTAPALIAAIPNCQVGSKAVCWVRNDGDDTLTITTNTGITLSGTAAVGTTLAQCLVFTCTAATTGSMHMVLKVAH